MMRTILKILTLLWITLWLFVATSLFLDNPKHRKKDKEFIETDIKPSVIFVKNFKSSHKRFPTYREYYTWESKMYKDYISDLNQPVDSLIVTDFGGHTYIRSNNIILPEDLPKFKKANWNKDFAIGVWHGEWAEYYFSWSDSYVSNKYSWFDGYVGLTLIVLFGFLPLLFWLLETKYRNYSSP